MTAPVARVLRRIRSATRSGRVRFTQKALWELEEFPIAFDAQDACDVLNWLRSADFDSAATSIETGETLYIFKPEVASVRLYVKLLMRAHCVVISFHEDRPDDVEEVKA